MRTVTTLIAFAWLACATAPKTSTGGDQVSPPLPHTQLLRVFKGTQLTMQLTPDSRILDGAGNPVGGFDARSRTVSVGEVKISLDQVVSNPSNEGFELDLPVGAWKIGVVAAGEVSINGERWGRVDGFETTATSLVRLEALFAALPLIPGIRPTVTI
jgi:hypothetical protein